MISLVVLVVTLLLPLALAAPSIILEPPEPRPSLDALQVNTQANVQLDINTTRCEWDDGFGALNCTSFSITFGNGGIWGYKTLVSIYLPFPPTSPPPDPKAGHDDDQSNFRKTQMELNCTNPTDSTSPDSIKHLGETWETVNGTSELGLPYVVSIHGGNACYSTQFPGEAFDNTWIKYADQWLNVPTDERCKAIYWNGKGRRCFIDINP
ncbi:hypothetical protein QBC35DRAFT_551891 [Podospora australis]|uniref:Ecp2 effector protein domain-containing protein n=1 Tax=Podospora australis TaxID=1536484 RepID=A0AAN6WSV3_9PEZI|nr:hypothetical protein QBC35DRAFT_551891 [Podospora australis]